MLVALAIVTTAWRSTRGWVPTTDWALIEAQVRGVGHTWPLLGSPSVLGFHHPGPLPILLLAPLYVLFGSDPHALLVSTATLNAGAIAGAAWTAWRRGGLPLVALTLGALVWVAGSLPPGFLRDPWNPWIAVFPFAWFLLLIWSVSVRDLVCLPIAVFVGSFVVQAHIGYVPIVALLFVFALGAVLWQVRRDRHARGEGRRFRTSSALLLALSAVVAVLSWALPLAQQLMSAPGNVNLTVRAMSRPDPLPLLTPGGVGGLVSREFGLTGPWLGFAEPVQGFTSSVASATWIGLLVPLAILAAGLWASRRNKAARLFVLVVAVADLASVAAMSRLHAEQVSTYVVRFTWVLAAFTLLATVWALASATHLRGAKPVASAVGVLVIGIGLIRFVAVDTPAQVQVYDTKTQALQQACVVQMLPRLLADAAGRRIHLEGTEFWPAVTAPIVNELERASIPVSVDSQLGFFLNRPGRDTAPDETSYVVVDQDHTAAWARRPEAVQVARCDSLPPEERAKVAALEAKSSLDTVEQLTVDLLLSRNVGASIYRVR